MTGKRSTRWAQERIEDRSSCSAEAKIWLLNKFVQRSSLSSSILIKWNSLENDGEEGSNLISSHQHPLSSSLGCFSCISHPSFHWTEALHSRRENNNTSAGLKRIGTTEVVVVMKQVPWNFLAERKMPSFASFFWTLRHLHTAFQMIKLNDISLFHVTMASVNEESATWASRG